jgi:hypothetical protein
MFAAKKEYFSIKIFLGVLKPLMVKRLGYFFLALPVLTGGMEQSGDTLF